MKKNKSLFDILFEDVMEDEIADLSSLGIDPDDEKLDDSKPENLDDDTVTITLTQAQVSVLKEILAQLESSDDTVDDMGDDLDDDMDDDLDGDMDDDLDDLDGSEDAKAFETVEAEVLGTPLVNQKATGLDKVAAGSNKVQGKVTSMAKTGKGSGHKFNHPNGTTEEDGHPLVNQKDRGNLTKVGPGSNKVATTATSTPNKEFFQ